MSWVAPANLHVTLKFLGEVDPSRLAGVAEALRAVAAASRAFDLGLAGVGAFPSPSRPRVLWAGVAEGADVLADLARRIDEALGALAFERETRPFTGHVTLGRVRVPRSAPALAAMLAADAGRVFGLVRVGEIALMRSDLSPQGSRYTVVETWPLGAQGP